MTIPFDVQVGAELNSLYEIALLPWSSMDLQDYFQRVLSILASYFPVGYSALILHDRERDYLCVEAIYGVGKDCHPAGCSRKGTMAKVLESRTPMALENLREEPLYREITAQPSQKKIRPPLLCVPLVTQNEAIGLLNIDSLYGARNEFSKDFLYLSILSAILSPAARCWLERNEENLAKNGKQRAKCMMLEEILGEKLSEVLNKIDPYVESKARLSLLDDIVAIVERILIKSALERVNHVQVAAARLLGINRNTLRKKIKELRINTR